jgi:hypothetical protein
MDLYAITSQEVLDRISRHCPTALSTYLQCINRANAEGTVFFDKQLVTNDMSESWAKFKNSIKKLSIENLLEWHLFNGGISITLVSQDEDE